MQQINFSSNPNGKLFNDIFGDVRLSDKEKYFTGALLEVLLKNKPIGYVKVVAVHEFRFIDLRDTFTFINCGKHSAYQARLLENYYQHQVSMKPDTRLMHVVMHYTERNIELHQALLQEWWEAKLAQQPNTNDTSNTLFNEA